MKVLTSLCCSLIIAVLSSNGKEVSYPPYGTFTNDPPFHKNWMLLPQTPREVGTEFFLFTRANPENGHLLYPLVGSRIRFSNFDASRKTVLISHGYTGGIDAPMNKPMTAALLQRGEFNVIVVAWKNGSYAAYNQASANCRLVGAQIGYLIELLHSETGLEFSNVHVIGYSLGAHVAAYAGRYIKKKGHALARITGLDPAAPLFEHEDTEVRLDKSDAEFVDVIHTNTQKVAIVTGIGMATPAGHIDFYVNGGGRQPGCLDLSDGVSKMFSCSHTRSYKLFIESIATGEAVKGYPCQAYSEFVRGKCSSFPLQGCPSFGYDSVKQRGLSAGKFYLKTLSKAPLLAYHYKLTFTTGTSMFSNLINGAIRVKLTGHKGTSHEVAFMRRSMGHGTMESFVAAIKDIGEPKEIKIWHVDPFQKWNVKKIVVQKFESKSRYYACVDIWLNSKDNSVSLSKSDSEKDCT